MTTWIKPLTFGEGLSVDEYNTICQNNFQKYADIQLTTEVDNTKQLLKAVAIDKNLWGASGDHIYLLVRNGEVMKIGGTRTPMSKRWSSYLCGFYTRERGYDGKMSVTNAYVYHTIEDDIRNRNGVWEIWVWKLPIVLTHVDILGKTFEIPAQVYHAYESVCMDKFKMRTGSIPQLCNNSDPAFRASE